VKTSRRLAAILAADVAGYSRLMEQDEAGTLAALKERRTGILAPLVAEHHGRIVKVMGDGVLVEFASAVNAVACAVELQKRMAAANNGLADERHIVLRIGINLGDVVAEGGDLYGHGVIIGTRLQALAAPGDIWIAASVHDQIEKKLALNFEDLGPREIKNMARPVHVYRIGTDALPAKITGGTGVPAKPSIAVLPFTNMSGDPEQQYFSDGVTEDIITELSRFRSLLVIARNSSFQYRGKDIDVRRVARELDVDYVIEGSIRRLDDHLRITAQLVDARTGNHVWAERYNRNMQDVFALQEEMAHSIAATVGGRVEAVRRDHAVRADPATLKAYDLVLRAKALAFKYSKHANEQSRAFTQKAIEIDPSSAQAHAYYGYSHFIEYVAHWVVDREHSLALAYEFGKKAVALDEDDIEARWKFGQVLLARGEFEEARVHFAKGLELNPNDTEAQCEFALYLDCIGQHNAAIEQYDLAKRLNPFDPSFIPWLKGIAYFGARRYGEAIALFNQIIEPINEVNGWLAASYAQAGRIAEAKAKLEEFLRGAERDMAVFPGRKLKDWGPYWQGAMWYRDQRDFDHLFAALHKAGLAD